MIKKVTMTGADDSINPSDLLVLSKKYSFVEWGILISKRSMGGNRFPSMNWIKQLANLKNDNQNLKLSCHLCGRWVNEFLIGEFDEIINSIPLDIFERIQINTHGIKHEYKTTAFKEMARMKHEIIFQYDNVNSIFLNIAREEDVKFSTLFDLSHGAGISPKEWPSPIDNVKCGYAGGLGDDNLEEQIKRIDIRTRNIDTWIDMETKVRSDNDFQFDLNKVEKCLQISDNFIKNSL